MLPTPFPTDDPPPPPEHNRAHILCPGPSLAYASIPDDHGIRIGVNIAGATIREYDWLCIGDAIAAQRCVEKGAAWPQVGFIAPLPFTMALRSYKPNAMMLPWEWLQMDFPRDYSANVAVWAAFVMGCREIHLWGCDQGGDVYADGTPCITDDAVKNLFGGDRQAAEENHRARWVDERARFQAVLRKIRGRAPETRLIRHLAQPIDLGAV